MHYLSYNEEKQHGTVDFPIEYYFVDERHPRYQMPFHWHKELEIIRVLEGLLYLTLDDEEVVGRAGDIVFINEGVVHGALPVHCIYECVVFDVQRLLMHTETCRAYIRRLTKHRLLVQNHFTRENKTFHRIVGHLFTAVKEQEDGSELITLGTLFEVFGIIYQKKLYEETERESKTAKKMMQIKPVLEFIDCNYGRAVTLEELSRAAGMSPKYFCRFFRSVIHRTPVDYLNYYRIERACYELTVSGLSMAEIAYRCGFGDVSYFIKMFKKYKGVTPKKYCRGFE